MVSQVLTRLEELRSELGFVRSQLDMTRPPYDTLQLMWLHREATLVAEIRAIEARQRS